MTTRLNYNRAKVRDRLARTSRADHDSPPRRDSVHGWRIEWPEPFPVTVSHVEPEPVRAGDRP